MTKIDTSSECYKIPKIVIDEWATKLTPRACVILMIFARSVYNPPAKDSITYKSILDSISLAQTDTTKGIKELIARGFIKCDCEVGRRYEASTRYSLISLDPNKCATKALSLERYSKEERNIFFKVAELIEQSRKN